MCERFSFSLPKEKISRRFGVKATGAIIPQYNIAPGHLIHIITDQKPQQLSRATWGIIQPNNTLSQLFIKSTTEKPIARTAQLLTQRCLILADGFYIWKKMSRKSRIPYRVTLKWNIPFALAGIWQASADKPDHFTCAIVTTTSNELIAPISDRMPLLLSLEQEKEWIQSTEAIKDITHLISPYPSDQMRMFPVSAQINQPDINILELTLPSIPADQYGNYVLFE